MACDPQIGEMEGTETRRCYRCRKVTEHTYVRCRSCGAGYRDCDVCGSRTEIGAA